MARCVMSGVVDTDQPGCPVVASCMVHTSVAPCFHDGEPASTAALHADTRPGRDAVVLFWWQRTHGQRTLVLHQGTFADDHEQSAGCWCRPEVLLGSPEPIPRPGPSAGTADR